MTRNLLAPAALLRIGQTHDRNVSPQEKKFGKDSKSFLEIFGKALTSIGKQSSDKSASTSGKNKSEDLIPNLVGIIMKKSTPDNAASLAVGHVTGNPTATLPAALDLGGELSGRVIAARADLMSRLAVNSAVQAVKEGNRESLLNVKTIGTEAGKGSIKLSGLYSEENLQSARELVSRLQNLPEAAKAIKKEGAQSDSDPAARLTLDPSKIKSLSSDAFAKAIDKTSDMKPFIFETASNVELKAFERLSTVRNENINAAAAARFDAGLLSQAVSLLHSEGFSLLRGKSLTSNQSENSPISESAAQPQVVESTEAASRVQKSEKPVLSSDAAQRGISEQNRHSVEGDGKAHAQLEEAAIKGEFARLAKSAEGLGLKDMAAVLRRETQILNTQNSGTVEGAAALNVKLDGLQANTGLGERLSDTRVSAALMERMVESAEWIRQNAKPTVRLQLAPQFLGGLEISLEAGENSARLHIVAERGQVARALESSAAQLALKLSEAGMPVEEIVVEHESFNFSGQNPDQNSASHRYFNDMEDGDRSVFRADKRAIRGLELIDKGRGAVSCHDGDIDLMA